MSGGESAQNFLFLQAWQGIVRAQIAVSSLRSVYRTREFFQMEKNLEKHSKYLIKYGEKVGAIVKVKKGAKL